MSKERVKELQNVYNNINTKWKSNVPPQLHQDMIELGMIERELRRDYPDEAKIGTTTHELIIYNSPHITVFHAKLMELDSIFQEILKNCKHP